MGDFRRKVLVVFNHLETEMEQTRINEEKLQRATYQQMLRFRKSVREIYDQFVKVWHHAHCAH